RRRLDARGRQTPASRRVAEGRHWLVGSCVRRRRPWWRRCRSAAAGRSLVRRLRSTTSRLHRTRAPPSVVDVRLAVGCPAATLGSMNKSVHLCYRPVVDQPRIPPATRRDMGLVNTAITGALGAAAGTGPPNLFTTLARHRRMFRPWLLFAGTLMPGGTLPRRDTELVILRVAHLCECEYEWHHHAQLARQAGLTDKELAAVLEGPAAAGWTPRQRLLLTAAEELLNTRTLSDETWQALRGELSERHLIELPMLVGHYEMLAMTINSLRIQPDTPRRPTGLARVVQALSARFTGRSA